MSCVPEVCSLIPLNLIADPSTVLPRVFFPSLFDAETHQKISTACCSGTSKEPSFLD